MAAVESVLQELGGNVIPVLAIVMAFSLGFFALTGGLLIGFVKAWRGGGKKRSSELDAQETRAFQELQRGFQRMEERLEALETLMIDRSRGIRPATKIEN